MRMFTRLIFPTCLLVSLLFSGNIPQISAGSMLSKYVQKDETYQWKVENYNWEFNESEISLEPENFIYLIGHNIPFLIRKVTNLPIEKSGSLYELTILSNFDRNDYYSIYSEDSFQLKLNNVELDLWTNVGYKGNFTWRTYIASDSFFDFFIYAVTHTYENGSTSEIFNTEPYSYELEPILDLWFNALNYYPKYITGDKLEYENDLSIHTITQFKCPTFNQSKFTCSSIEDYTDIAIMNSKAINTQTGILDGLQYYYDFDINDSKMIFNYELGYLETEVELVTPRNLPLLILAITTITIIVIIGIRKRKST